MLPVLILYATREGQSRRIAEHAAARLRRKELPVQILDAAELPPAFALERYAGALLVAPVHAGQHARELRRLLIDWRAQLERLPTRLLSVSLSQAGAEMGSASAAQRSKAAQDVQQLITLLCKQTGFAASNVSPVAGALAYTQYSFLKRLLMRRIARQAGGATDTSRDHVYTDYARLDGIVDEFAAQLPLSVQHALSA
jgi:menaquinone-dependent protoporphyrinogen oxidase